MITHKKNPHITKWFSRHAKSMIQKNFYRCSLTPESVIPKFEKGVPTIAISNHSSWWDAMLGMYLGYFVFKRDFYGVFAEEQLRRYGIFRLVGAYSVDRSAPRQMPQFLDYTTQLLKGEDRLLWIYPQGELYSNEIPIEFKTGFARIISRLPKVQLLKMVVSYDFWIESKPEIVIDLLPLETLNPTQDRDFVKTLNQRASEELKERMGVVRRIVRNREEGLKPLLLQEHGTNPVYDGYRWLKSKLKRETFTKSHHMNGVS